MNIWGTAKKGKWRVCANIEEIKPDTIYEFSYTVPKKNWWEFWKWFSEFNSDEFSKKIQEEVSQMLDTDKERVNIIWYEYNASTNGEDGQFNIQLSYQSLVIQPAFAISTTIVLITLAVGGCISVYLLGITFREVRELLKEVPELPKYITTSLGILAFCFLLCFLLLRKK